MKHDPLENASAIEAALHLKRTFLRAALAVAGSAKSSPESNRVAGAEVTRLKREIAEHERQLEVAKAA